MNHNKYVGKQRKRRSMRVRRSLEGKNLVTHRPRLCVFRSHKHMYAQVIDDAAGRTLAAANSRDEAVLGDLKTGGNKAAAAAVGKAIAERSLAAGVKEVALDRRSCKYHGRIAALADAAREAGLTF